MAEYSCNKAASSFFSIILPCYNVEPYIARCIDSLRAQSFVDFEVLCLDDGSKDGTKEALQGAIRDDSRFRVILSGENRGVSFQRNRGLELASGEYVLFFDADDWVVPEALSTIFKAIERDDPDIIVFGASSSPHSKWIAEKTSPRKVTLHNAGCEALFHEPGCRPFAWNKAYRRDMLIQYKCLFDERLTLGEDQAFQFVAFPYAQTISFLPVKLYRYNMANSASAMTSANQDEQEKACGHVRLVGAVVDQWRERKLLSDDSNLSELSNWAIDYLFEGLMGLPEGILRQQAIEVSNWFSGGGLSEQSLTEQNALRLRCLEGFLDAPAVPEVSIVMPMYNAERFLGEALACLRAQTFPAFEVLMVDDGSDDRTVRIAEEYANLDSRFNLMCQEHLFAGEARNKGIEVACGDYLLFLDADDWFDADMIEKALACAKESDAEICAYAARAYDMPSRKVREWPWTCKTHLVPTDRAFSSRDYPDTIFCFTTPAPWLKLFRADFVKKNNLRFQATRSANDLLFVFSALALADRIVVLGEALLTYRINEGSSLQSTQDKDPFAFYEATLALRSALVEHDRYALIEKAFLNFALDYCLYNLGTLKTRKAFDQLYRFLKDTAFDELKLKDAPMGIFCNYTPNNYERFQFILGNSPRAYRKEFPTQHSVPTIRRRIASRFKWLSKMKRALRGRG